MQIIKTIITLIITTFFLFSICYANEINNNPNYINDKNINLYSNSNNALIAYWSLDEGIGNIANDYSGHNLSGIIYGATWSSGYTNYSLSFDGINDFIDLDNHAQNLGFNKTDDYKVSAWFKTASNHPGYIYMISDDSDPLPVFYIKIRNNGTIEMKVQSTSTCTIQITSTTKYNDGLWHFIEGIYQGSEGYPDLELYVDNEFVSSGEDWLCPMFYNQFTGARIGMSSYDSSNYFGGLIDEIKVYKRSTDNQPPNPPIVSGPIVGTIGQLYNYSFYLSDPEWDESYLSVDWGDNLTTGWIGPFNSNENVTLNHFWLENGLYEINAKSRDIFDVGDSGTLIIVMGNIAPTKPTIEGSLFGNKGEQLEYYINSTDLNGHDIKYYIDWGDGWSEWTEFYKSGEEVKLEHNWSEKGIYNVMVKAYDIYNAESEWSIPFEVIVTEKFFIFGFLINKSSDDNLIQFNARFLLFIGLNPFYRQVYSSEEKVIISYPYIGNLGDNFIFGIFDAVVI